MNTVSLIVTFSFALAATELPKLERVDTGKLPLKLSAPAGWRVTTNPPKRKDLSTIAAISPSCGAGPDISVVIQLDQRMTKPSQLLADQYSGVKPTKVRGWECIARAAYTEVMCAGKLKGLSGVVGVYFATTDEPSYLRFGDPTEFTAQIAASLSWSGKLAALEEWSRDATPESESACK
jgi:hypothetical protein